MIQFYQSWRLLLQHKWDWEKNSNAWFLLEKSKVIQTFAINFGKLSSSYSSVYQILTSTTPDLIEWLVTIKKLETFPQNIQFFLFKTHLTLHKSTRRLQPPNQKKNYIIKKLHETVQ